MADRILEVQAVEKRFDRIQAVDGLSFEVRRGEILALLGPNGAGKTTMARMLMGVLRPDRGEIRFTLSDGKTRKPAPGELGYLPEDRGLYPELPALRTLTYFGVLRGMERRMASGAAEQWLERLGLRERAGDKLSALSKGNQQKVQFIASILHAPAFAVLDEPFGGLDPVNQESFLELIRDLRDRGMTVLLSAHQMQLVERIADRILLMNRGREVLSGTLEEIRRRARAANKIVLQVEGQPDPAVFEGHPAIRVAQRTAENEITLLVEERTPLSDFLVAVGRAVKVVAIHSERESLHDIFVRMVGADRETKTKGAEE